MDIEERVDVSAAGVDQIGCNIPVVWGYTVSNVDSFCDG